MAILFSEYLGGGRLFRVGVVGDGSSGEGFRAEFQAGDVYRWTKPRRIEMAPWVCRAIRMGGDGRFGIGLGQLLLGGGKAQDRR